MQDNKNQTGEISLGEILDEYSPKASKAAVRDDDIDKIVSEVTGEFAPVRPRTPPPKRPASANERPEISFGTQTKPTKKAAGQAAEDIRSLTEAMPVPSKKPSAPEKKEAKPEAAPADDGVKSEKETAAAAAARETRQEQKNEQADKAADDVESGTGFGSEVESELANEPETEEEKDDSKTPATDDDISEQADDAEEQYVYTPDPMSRGAGFTMRTSDDDDRKKTATAQNEYTRRGEEKLILAQIQKLKSALTMRAAVLLFSSVFSMFITVANDLKLPLAAVFDKTVNPAAYLFTNTILGIAAIGMSYSVVTLGIKNLFRLSPDSDSAAALALLTSVLGGLVMLFDPEPLKSGFFHVYTAAALLGMFFNTLGKLSVVHRTQRNFEFISKNKKFAAVKQVTDPDTVAYITNGSAGSRRELAVMSETDFVRDFMKNSYSSDLADLYAEKTTPVVLLAAIAVGVLSLMFDKSAENSLQKAFVFLAAMSGTVSLTTSFALALVANLPLMNASKRALGFSGVITGYSSIEEFGEVNSILIDGDDLFPVGTVEFTNLKVLGSYTLDKAIIYAASVASEGKSVTQPAFYKMLRGETGMLIPAQQCKAEEGMGLICRIKGETVMLGSRKQMEKHGVDGLPPESSEDRFAGRNSILYLAVSGHAMMMFAVRLTVGRTARRWIQRLEDERISMFVRISDGFIDRRLIASLFDIDPSFVNILSPEFDKDYSELTKPESSVSASMLCTGHLPTLAMLLSAAKRVKSAANMGVAIQYAAMVLGIVLSVLMMMSGSFAQITPTVTIIYELAFLLLTVIMQRFMKV